MIKNFNLKFLHTIQLYRNYFNFIVKNNKYILKTIVST